MIFTERTITVVNDSATINKPLILYRGDKNIELKITIAESQFKFRNNDASNVIETTDASYAQLVINTPYNSPIFSDVAVTKNGAVIFVITEAMIDEIREVGAYEIQIRLLDDNKQSRASIPPVSNAIEIREPIAIEDGSAVDSNAVNVAKVNRALTTTSAPLEAFDSQGNYIKNIWGDGVLITDAALNKMEAGIDGVNKKIGNVNWQIKEVATKTITTEERTKLNNLENYDDSSIKNDIQIQKARIDSFTSLQEGSTTGDAELIDIRVSATGNINSNAGNTVRKIETELISTPGLNEITLIGSIELHQCVTTNGDINKNYYTQEHYRVTYYNVETVRSINLNAASSGGAAIRTYAFYSESTIDNVSSNNVILINSYVDNTDTEIIVPLGAKILAVSYYGDNCHVTEKSKNLKGTFELLATKINDNFNNIDSIKNDVYVDKKTTINIIRRDPWYTDKDGTTHSFGTYCTDIAKVENYEKLSFTPSTVNNYKPYIIFFSDEDLKNIVSYITFTSDVPVTLDIPKTAKYVAINTISSYNYILFGIKKEYVLSNSNNYKNKKISGVGDSLSTGFSYLNACVTDLDMIKSGVQKGGVCVSGTSEDAFWQSKVINNIDNDTNVIAIMGGTNDVFQNKTIGDVSITNFDTNTFVGAYNVLISKLYYKFLNVNGYYESVIYSDIIKIDSPFKILPIILIKPPMCLTNGKFDKIKEIGDIVEKIGYMWGLPVIDSNKIFANPITLTSKDLIHGVMANFNYLGNLIVETLQKYNSSMNILGETLGTKYSISTSIADGSIDVVNGAYEGDTVNFIINKSSYSNVTITDNITVTTVDASKHSYSFKMPNKNVTITVS